MHPYAGLAGSVTNSVSLEAEAVKDAVVRGALRFEPSTDLQLQADVYHFDAAVRDPILTPEGRTGQVTLSAFFRPISRMGATYLEASLDRVTTSTSVLASSRGARSSGGDPDFPRSGFSGKSGPDPTRARPTSASTIVLPHPAWVRYWQLLSQDHLRNSRPASGPSASATSERHYSGTRAETGMTWFRGHVRLRRSRRGTSSVRPTRR
jgi:hypothetical protein